MGTFDTSGADYEKFKNLLGIVAEKLRSADLVLAAGEDMRNPEGRAARYLFDAVQALDLVVRDILHGLQK